MSIVHLIVPKLMPHVLIVQMEIQMMKVNTKVHPRS